MDHNTKNENSLKETKSEKYELFKSKRLGMRFGYYSDMNAAKLRC